MAPPEAPSSQTTAHSVFDKFLLARSCEETLATFRELCRCLDLQPEPDGQLQFYQKLKSRLNYWKAKALWTKLDKKASHIVYNEATPCAKTRCLVVGAGPCGLRTAIELAFLGAKVIVVEKRKSFSRNNVLHLWPFSILDLRGLGAKKYHGRFCTGTLDHVSIRQLQLILLKTTLLLGVEVFVGISFKDPVPPPAEVKTPGKGWTASFQTTNSYLAQFQFDVLISAGGSKFIPDGFQRKELRGKLAIGITANFINKHTAAEVKVAEISGVARIYNQKFFKNLLKDTGIDLENIVYYKDDTHYFVMTAKKQSLLKMGVILQDLPDTDSLLSPANVDSEALFKYAQDAANFSTGYQLPQMEFALNHHQRPDVDMFDFTCMYRAENAALVRERRGARLLIGLVGDCLVEPFWPLGTGVARGFLAAYDAAWMVKKWASGAPPLEVLAERESIYQHLSQTTPGNTNKKISQYNIDPASRYPNINLKAIKPSQVRHLYDTGYTERQQSNAEAKTRRTKFSRNDSLSVYDELLKWCKNQTAGYRGVAVTDFAQSWRSGLALCALIHRFRPQHFDFASLDQNAAVYNNQLAIDVAEQELGILPILTSTEMACLSETDRLSLVTYLSQLYEAFKDEPLLSPFAPEHVAGEVKKRATFSGAKSALLFLNKLQKTMSLKRNCKGSYDLDFETKRTKSGSIESPLETPSPQGDYVNWPLTPDQADSRSSGNPQGSPGSSSSINSERSNGDAVGLTVHPEMVIDGEQSRHPSSTESPKSLPSVEPRYPTLRGQTLTGSSDACYFCGQRVYILERVSAEGWFFHRSCFRCHDCDATLRLGNYVYNEENGYFYCMIHAGESFEMIQSGISKQDDEHGNLHYSAADLDNRDPSLTQQPSAPTEPPPLTSLVSDDVFQPSSVPPGAQNLVFLPARPKLPEFTMNVPFEAKAWEDDGEAQNGSRPNSGALSNRGQNVIEKSQPRRHSELMRLAKSVAPEASGPQPDEQTVKSKILKRRINLSTLEKEQLSRLSLDLGNEPDQKGFESGILNQGTHSTDSCDSEEESTEDEEEEEKEELRKTIPPVREVNPISRIESCKVRTLQRRAKEGEMKRFCKAQSIQRRLEEIEEQFRVLEQRGIELEQSLRTCCESDEQAELIYKWLLLVQDKNVLVSEESDLMIAAQELDLEEQQSLLVQQLQHYQYMDGKLKTPKDRAEEAQILKMMLEVVDKRNALITFLEEKRLYDTTQQLRKMH
ncbi:F-actin-monooxygenase MICAL1 isoform X2 [Lissotriton helveticus]